MAITKRILDLCICSWFEALSGATKRHLVCISSSQREGREGGREGGRKRKMVEQTDWTEDGHMKIIFF